jgi:hypothetical protein
MSNAFTNWLTSARAIDPKAGGVPIMKDYQHASRLYIDDTFSLTPKLGFLYFISFNINREAILSETWANRDSNDFSLLAKKVDLPKFRIATETLNQYNRKTVVQTKLNYEPVSIEFHDDNADIVNGFWVNYYKHYYADSNYGGGAVGQPEQNQSVKEFGDTKYGEIDYNYGRSDSIKTQKPFLSSIDIYVLYKHQFTQITLLNPKITEWMHDSLNQTEGTKIMQNRMGIMYENVLYNQGFITPGKIPEEFGEARYYDTTPSPYGVAGTPVNQTLNRSQSPFDKPGKDRVFGRIGGPDSRRNGLLDIGKILANNYLNRNGLGKAKSTGYNIASGVLGAVTGSGAGKYAEPPPSTNQPGIINLPGGVNINIFKGLNKSVDGKIRANPAALIFPKLGGGGG